MYNIEKINRMIDDINRFFLELDEITRNPHAQVCEETRFIHYIDWRILENKIVPMQQRIEYIYEKYGPWLRQQNINWPEMKQEQFQY